MSATSVRDWCTTDRSQIMAKDVDPNTKRTVQRILDDALEKRLVKFISDNVKCGFPITGAIICAQARLWFEAAQSDIPVEDMIVFHASDGWLDRFKKHHGIKEY